MQNTCKINHNERLKMSWDNQIKIMEIYNSLNLHDKLELFRRILENDVVVFNRSGRDLSSPEDSRIDPDNLAINGTSIQVELGEDKNGNT